MTGGEHRPGYWFRRR